MKNKKKKIKRKIKWKSIIKILSIIIFVMIIYLGLKLIPTNHIVVKGNTYLNDNEIIEDSLYNN